MDTEKILNLPKYHRRAFIGVIISITIILVLIDFFIIPLAPPQIAEITSGYARSIVAALLVSIVVLWIFLAFIPPATAKSVGIEQIEPTRITAEFDALFKEAKRWRYKGNFGRYQRGKVLPTLHTQANFHTSICIIDPTDKQLCEQHADFRNNIPAIDKGRNYDANLVALEVVVTILHCAWYSANKASNIELFLSATFDPVRIDSNDIAMILTVEDRRSPALKILSSHFMYEHFDLQMRYTREQSKQVKLGGFAKRNSISDIEEIDIEQFLKKIGMKKLCDQLTATKILAECKRAKNPYEN